MLLELPTLSYSASHHPPVSDLNDRQRAAIAYLDGPLLVLAGAGSGKTRVITHKIAHIIGTERHAARHIAAVTFTNKAAREMQQRVRQLLDAKAGRGLRISTFHTLGLTLLRQETKAFAYKPGFTILDSHDSQALLRDLLRRNLNDEQSEHLQRRISAWKNALITPELASSAAANDTALQAAARLYAEYARHLRAYNAVDFDDLIMQPVHLLRSDPDLLERWRYQIRYLLVDEYQDTNATQYELVRLLAGATGSLTVVGDDDQSIYAWRGAQPENLAQLQTDYPNLRVIKLEQNYRSRGNILNAANQLIANNGHVFEKSLWSALAYGDPIKVINAASEEDEAERVVDMINHHRLLQRSSFGDYAILYRSNHQARIFERALREREIPYQISGGSSFFDYAEVKDILAYLRLLVNRDDDVAFLRIINTPRREIGAATVEKLADYASQRGVSLLTACQEFGLEQRLTERAVQNLREFSSWIDRLATLATTEPPASICKTVIQDLDYQAWLEDLFADERAAQRRMKNVLELVEWLDHMNQRGAEQGQGTLEDLIAKIALMDLMDRQQDANPGPKVQMMTLHAAKGLEFPHVFMVGMEENLLPHRNSIDSDTIEEERRLCYVGITRAQTSLVFSLAATRKRYQEQEICEPSRFLAELPQADLQWEGVGREPVVTKQEGRENLARLRHLLSDKSSG
jgi:ATP-dependent DNA helicase Rep